MGVKKGDVVRADVGGVLKKVRVIEVNGDEAKVECPEQGLVTIQVKSLSPFPQLLLSMSGGGFRATIFHLGVLRYLLDKGLLSDVKVVCAVSGGSITAAHLGASWHDFSTSVASFLDRQREIKDLTRIGVRERLVLRIFPYWLARRFGFQWTITQRLASYYNETLFKNKNLITLSEAAKNGAPRIILMATNLTRHSSACYFDTHKYIFGGPKAVVLDGYPISKAVAASSAFPFLFPPVRLNPDDPDSKSSKTEFQANEHYLTDGGVFENLGISVLREVKPTLAEHSIIVVSDAGRKLDWDFSDQSKRGYLTGLLRSSEIIQYWAEQRLCAGMGADEIVIRIDDDVPGRPRNEINALSQLRTDLDSFSELEWHYLYDMGYAAAKEKLSHLGSGSGVTYKEPYAPWQNIDTNYSAQVIQRKLDQGSRRRRLPLVWDFALAAYLVLGMLTLGVLAYGFPALWRRGENLVHFASDAMRPDYPGKRIAFEDPVEVGLLTDLEKTDFTDDTKRAILDRIRLYAEEFVQSGGAAPKDVKLLLIRQSAPFKADFKSLIGWRLKFEGNAEATSGVAFVVNSKSSNPDVGYREAHLPRKTGSGHILEGTVTAEKPKSGEQLVFLLRVERRDKLEGSKRFPGSSFDEYGFYLEKQ